jgi:hypothetical protein
MRDGWVLLDVRPPSEVSKVGGGCCGGRHPEAAPPAGGPGGHGAALRSARPPRALAAAPQPSAPPPAAAPAAPQVPIAGAVEVPLFVPDTRMELASLLANWAAYGTGGWWLGGAHFTPNTSFLAQVGVGVGPRARQPGEGKGGGSSAGGGRCWWWC